jgi:hypothetical protein
VVNSGLFGGLGDHDNNEDNELLANPVVQKNTTENLLQTIARRVIYGGTLLKSDILNMKRLLFRASRGQAG